jgi:hypothetical protein
VLPKLAYLTGMCKGLKPDEQCRCQPQNSASFPAYLRGFETM